MVGIISNNAALSAQANLQKASDQSQLSISRLSSGNRIIRASDDVAGLAVGTVLRTNVSTLQTALTSASQATTLLQIADGGLQNISDILQRQKALAVSANSGTLSDTERAFLNEEFQNLTKQINQLTDSTNFNGIKLLNGGISGDAGLKTAQATLSKNYTIDNLNDYTVTGAVDGTSQIAASSTLNLTDDVGETTSFGTFRITTAFAANDTLTINGTTFTFVATALGAEAANEISVNGAATAALQIDRIVDKLNTVNSTNSGTVDKATYSNNDVDTVMIHYNGAGAGGNSFAITNASATGSISINSQATSTTATGTLLGGRDFLDAHNAHGTMKFTGTAIVATDQIMINGSMMVAAAANAALTFDASGTTLKADLTQLALALNASANGNIDDATYVFDGIDTIHVYHDTASTAGNTFTLGGAASNLAAAGNTSVSINGLANSTAPTTARNLGTSGNGEAYRAARSSTFSQNIQGQLTNLSGQIYDGTTPDTNHFTSNAIQLTVELNGKIYTSNLVNLAGGDRINGANTGTGYNGLGNHVAGGTTITFRDLTAPDTQIGFTLTVDSTGFDIAGATKIDAQADLQSTLATIQTALTNGNVKVGINAPSTTYQSYSVDSLADYGGQGTVANGYNLAGSVSIPSTIGDAFATTGGTIDATGGYANGDTITINGTTILLSTTATGVANEIVVTGGGGALVADSRIIAAALNASTDSNLQNFTYTFDGTATLSVHAKNAGTVGNIAISQSGLVSATDLSGGTDRAAPTTFPTSLLGGISNFNTIYTAGSGSSTDSFTANSVVFTATVGGVEYRSQAVQLSGGNYANSVAAGSGYNGFGDRIVGGQALTFTNPLDSTQPGFQITLDSDGYTLTGTNSTQVTAELRSLAQGFGTGLANGNVSITQNRELSSLSVDAAQGTVLDGLKASSIGLISSDFTADGTHGQIGVFTVDAAHDKVSVQIDGKTYSQVLSGSVADGGLGSRYDSVNKVILGGYNTTLTLRSENDTTDGRQLTINLLNVNNIQINNDASAKSLSDALNGVFNVGNKSALNFQIGLTASDKITVALGDARTTALYKDDNGVAQTLDVGTAAGADIASSVLDNAINSLVTLRSTVGAFQSRFGFVSSNLQTGIQNTDAARGQFLDANIEQESTNFAQSQVRLQASIAVLAQANQLPQNLLKLIG